MKSVQEKLKNLKINVDLTSAPTQKKITLDLDGNLHFTKVADPKVNMIMNKGFRDGSLPNIYENIVGIPAIAPPVEIPNIILEQVATRYDPINGLTRVWNDRDFQDAVINYIMTNQEFSKLRGE